MADYEENLKTSLDLIEKEYDRIDNDIQRMVDRTEGMLKVYLLATSLLVSALTLNESNDVSNWIKFTAPAIIIPINAIFLKYSIIDTFKPQEFTKFDFNLDHSKSMLPREKLNGSEKGLLEYVNNGINQLNQQNREKLENLETSFKNTHRWFIISIVTNILAVLIYWVI